MGEQELMGFFRIFVWLIILQVACAVGGESVVCAAEDHAVEASSGEGEPKVSDDRHPLVQLLFPYERNYNIPPIQPNLQMFLTSLVIFGGLVFLTTRTSWIPLIAGVNAREARVVNAERDAQAARDEIVKLRAETDARLAEVQDQVKAVIAEARSEAEAQKREILANAEQEAQRIKDEALQAIDEAQRDALANLDQMVDEQVGLATEHVVGRRL